MAKGIFLTEDHVNIKSMEKGMFCPATVSKFSSEYQQNLSSEESDSWKTFYRNWTATNTLKNDRRTELFSGKEKTDSDEMTRVKKYAGKITEHLMAPISENQDIFQFQRNNFNYLYIELILSCEDYLEKRKHGWKKIYHYGEGYRRYQLVKQTLVRAKIEQHQLQNMAQSYYDDFKDEKKRPLWINVLSDCRTTKIDLNNANIERVGGNCNSVLKVTPKKGGSSGYIKERDYNLSEAQKKEQCIEQILKSNLVAEMVTNEEIFGDIPQNDRKPLIKDTLFIIEKYFKSFDFDKLFGSAKELFKEEQQASLMNKLREVMYTAKLPEDINKDQISRVNNLLNKKNQTLNRFVGEFGASYRRYTLDRNLSVFAKIPDNADITSRNVATYRLAELLGIPNLIPAATKVKYKDDRETEHQGILMEGTIGDTLHSVKESFATNYEDVVCMQLNSLQILDTLAGQVDRHMGNILLKKNISNPNYTGVVGIDNDMCFGNLSYKDYNERGKFKRSRITPLENKNGITINLIDKKVYDRVMALDDSVVTYMFQDLLGKEEMAAFLDRIHGVQKLFKSIDHKHSVMICNMNKLTKLEVTRAVLYQNGTPESYINKLEANHHNEMNIINQAISENEWGSLKIAMSKLNCAFPMNKSK